MSDNPIGKDGVERVLARVRLEAKIQRRESEDEVDAWLGDILDSHKFVDIFTEGERVLEAAYFRGHMIVAVFGTMSLTILALSVLLYIRW